MDLRSESLTVIARLRAAQVTQVINAILGEIILISTRGFLQSILSSYYIGNQTIDPSSISDFHLILESTDNAVAGYIYSDSFEEILSSTRNETTSHSQFPSTLLPLEDPDSVNISYVNSLNAYMKGPVNVNGTFYLSFTRALTRNLPDFENTNQTFFQNIVGYLTVISHATSLLNVTKDFNLEESTKMSLIRLSGNQTRSQARKTTTPMNYSLVLPSDSCPSCFGKNITLSPRTPQYSALVDGIWGTTRGIQLSCCGKVAIAFAPVSSISKVWGVLIIQSQSVLYKPINTLRRILCVCVFSIGFGVCVATFLLSGWVVKPITRLQAATEQYNSNISKSKEYGKFWKFFTFRKRPNPDGPRNFSEKQSPYTSSAGSEFRIPEQVVTRKYIKDELTELTETFNEMTSELRKQYAVLEERVVQRTKEIKAAKVHAETANEAKSLFIANITHELRTPLNGILGMAAVSMKENDPENTREALKIIFKSGELLLRLLTDLLGFSKSQVDNMKLEPKGFLIAEVTAQLNAIFYEQSRSNKINFSIQVHNQNLFRLELLGDINRILQVVMNLVSNSFKFTPPDGEIAVDISASLLDGGDFNYFDELLQNFNTSSNFSLPARFNSIHLTISVRDNGPGIAPHLQSKIFDPFVQGDLGMSEKRGGVGLGLSICVQLAHLMNGQISLDSELGRGSTFSFSIPLHVIRVLDLKEVGSMPVNSAISPSSCAKIFPAILDHSPDDSDDHAQKSSDSVVQDSSLQCVSRPFENISVLIAEDNKVNQEVLLRMLKLEGISNMIVAKDGFEAVNAVKAQMQDKKSFDIIFMDIQMPNLDGKQATEIIRNELHYQGTIIAVSAFTDHSNIEDCLAVGMNHFLAKPLRRPQLHSLLEDLQNWRPSE